jgi:hypothetical protein
VSLYRHTLGLEASELALSQHMAAALFVTERGIDALAPDDVDVDPSEVAGVLLRLRLLEDMTLRLRRPTDALRYALCADSLQQQLAMRFDPAWSDASVALALAAGMPVSEARWAPLQTRLYTGWRQLRFSTQPTRNWAGAFLLFHVLCQRDGRVLQDVRLHAARTTAEATLRELGTSIASQDLRVWRANDAGRRLRIAAEQLTTSGAAPATVQAMAERIVAMPTEAAAYAGSAAAIDSLESIVGSIATPRQRPETARVGAAETRRAVDLAIRALAALRAERGTDVLRQLGVRVQASVDPIEAVHGQGIVVTWSIESSQRRPVSSWTATLFGKPVVLGGAPASLQPDSTSRLRGSPVVVPAHGVGAVLDAAPELRFGLDGFGEIFCREPEAVRVVSPVQAFLALRDGPLLGRSPKAVHVTVTNRSPVPVEGTLRLVPTAEWLVTPAREFRFRLRRPGQSAEQDVQVSLAPDASPGPYDVTFRVTAAGSDLGTMRAQLVKPVQWLAVGPFPEPVGGNRLEPEAGFGFAQTFRTTDGTPVSWQLAPVEVFDVDGALDLAALYGDGPRRDCACLFTVFESSGRETVQLDFVTAAAAYWNGVPVQDDASVPLRAGHNTALLRVCRTSGTWRLAMSVRSRTGNVHRAISNDLERLLRGLGELRTARARGATQDEQWVTVRYTGATAGDVAVLGAFNAWAPLALDRQADGSWKKDLLLKPGRYAYKLMIDGRLRPDPAARASEPDGFGGRNSLLVVP